MLKQNQFYTNKFFKKESKKLELPSSKDETIFLHNTVQTTIGYLRDVEQDLKLTPYDWFNALLRFQTQDDKYINYDILKQQKGLERLRAVKIKKRGYCLKSLLLRGMGPAGFEPATIWL